MLIHDPQTKNLQKLNSLTGLLFIPISPIFETTNKKANTMNITQLIAVTNLRPF